MSGNTPEQLRRSINKFRLEKEKNGERRLLVEMPDALSHWIDAVRAGTGASRQELILALLEDRVARLGAPPAAGPRP